MPLRYLSDLAGTLNSFLRISGLRLKNTSNTSIDVRNNADTQYANARVQQVALLRQTGTNSVSLGIGSEPAGNITFSLPVTVGSSNQVLSTDGSTGQLSWATVATANGQVLSDQTALAFGSVSPVACFTPPANCIIRKVIVDVDVAFTTGTPSLSIGVSGSTTRYMTATEVDLTVAATYETVPMYQEDGTPEPIILTYAAGGVSAGSATVVIEYSNPA